MTATLPLYFPSGNTSLDVIAILDRLTSDPGTGSEVALIVEGVVEVARAHDGRVDTNDLREWLHDPEHDVWLTRPQLVGAVVSRLARTGVLKPAGWTVSTDRRGGNAGKPCRVWRLAGDPR